MSPNDGIPTHVVPMVLLAIKAHLEQKLIDEVPETNPTRVTLVKIGRFQENPIEKNVSVSISGGDYEDPQYLDARVNNPEVTNFPLRNIPIGEIGGGCYWFRRGTINFQAFFVRQNYPEETAMQYAYDFYGRLLQSVEEVNVSNLVDDFGEGVVPPIYVEGNSMFEAGGKDKYIWRGKLLWRVLTWRP
jgi:hypothetical protein